MLVCCSYMKGQSSTRLELFKAKVAFQIQSLNMRGFNVVFQVCADFRHFSTLDALVNRSSIFICCPREKRLNHLVNG